MEYIPKRVSDDILYAKEDPFTRCAGASRYITQSP